MTGAARRRFIRDGLTTPDGSRKAAALELVAELTTAGFSADTAEVRKSGAAIKFVRLPKVSALRQSKAAKAAAELAELRAEIERLKAGAKA
jgi:antirestriction protein ArdC